MTKLEMWDLCCSTTIWGIEKCDECEQILNEGIDEGIEFKSCGHYITLCKKCWLGDKNENKINTKQ